MTRLPHPDDIQREAECCEAYGQGERAERERIRQILESSEAIGREGMALHLAVRTDLPARTAIALMSHAGRAEAPAHRVRPLRWPAVIFQIEGITHVGFDQLTERSG